MIPNPSLGMPAAVPTITGVDPGFWIRAPTRGSFLRDDAFQVRHRDVAATEGFGWAFRIVGWRSLPTCPARSSKPIQLRSG